jgi:hypothetical protein
MKPPIIGNRNFHFASRPRLADHFSQTVRRHVGVINLSVAFDVRAGDWKPLAPWNSFWNVYRPILDTLPSTVIRAYCLFWIKFVGLRPRVARLTESNPVKSPSRNQERRTPCDR